MLDKEIKERIVAEIEELKRYMALSARRLTENPEHNWSEASEIVFSRGELKAYENILHSFGDK